MKEFKNPRADLLEDDTHSHVEKDVFELLSSEKPYVVEGWLAGFIARELPHTLRIYAVSYTHLDVYKRQI